MIACAETFGLFPIWEALRMMRLVERASPPEHLMRMYTYILCTLACQGYRAGVEAVASSLPKAVQERINASV